MAKAGVRGGRQLAAKLRSIGHAPTVAERRRARQAALQPILEDAALNLAANGSVESGQLLRGLAIKGKNRNEDRFGQRGKHSPVAHLVEYGTAPHWQPRLGIMHPGARPKPFVQPAYQINKLEAIAIYAAMMWAVITRSAR
jgi:hypothetical protein